MESTNEKKKRKNSPVVVNLFWRVDRILLKSSWVDRVVKVVVVLVRRYLKPNKTIDNLFVSIQIAITVQGNTTKQSLNISYLPHINLTLH